MEWTDDGIVLGVRRHGEGNGILDVMTAEHGRHLGLVRGGSGSRLRPVLQPGNTVRLVWRARLDEHLGHFAVEPLRLRAADLLSVPHALYGLTHVCALVRLLPERDSHPEVFAAMDAIIERLSDGSRTAVNIVRFELMLLAELGFGLDLASCAATGARADLIYVSPKSGRAVSRNAGEPWADRLLRLPPFLTELGEASQAPLPTIADGFALTGYFLARHVLDPRGLRMPDARAQFLASITQQETRGAA